MVFSCHLSDWWVGFHVNQLAHISLPTCYVISRVNTYIQLYLIMQVIQTKAEVIQTKLLVMNINIERLQNTRPFGRCITLKFEVK